MKKKGTGKQQPGEPKQGYLFDIPPAPQLKTEDESPPVRAIIHFDGLCEPKNPGGHCCYGYTIKPENGKLITGKGYVGRGTNNKAEYSALIEALKEARKLGIKEVHAFGDSLLVVNQVKGIWNVNAETIKPLWKQAVHLAHSFVLFGIEWIPREQNETADQLSREAYKGVKDTAQRKQAEKAQTEGNHTIKNRKEQK